MSVQIDMGMPDELFEKICAFVEREAGRDVPLSLEDETMVRSLLETDPAVQTVADELRGGIAGADALFSAGADMPVPDDLTTMIMAHGALREKKSGGADGVEAEPTTGEVVPFRSESTKTARSYGWLAAAASLALAITGGTLVYNIQTQTALERTVAQLEDQRSTQRTQYEALQTETGSLEERLAAAVDDRQEAETAFSAASGNVARLEAELSTVMAAQADAEQSLTTAETELESALRAGADLEQQLAALEAETSQAEAQSTAERNRLEDQVAGLEGQLAAANEVQETAEAEFAKVNTTIAELIEEGVALNQEVATLQEQTDGLETELASRGQQLTDAETAIAQFEQQAVELATERETLASRIDSRDQELEAKEIALVEAEEKIAKLDDQRTSLTTEVEQSEQALASAQNQLETVQNQSVAFQTALEQLRIQSGWLAQVGGYHLGYAGQPREVEVGAGEEISNQALSKWLSGQLGRDIVIPDLTDAGMTFVGGRLFFVNGQPVGQIAYHDRQGRLTGFCLKRNPTGTAKGLSQSQFGNALQMISWQDQDYQYVLVGFADFETLEPVAAQLESMYSDEI